MAWVVAAVLVIVALFTLGSADTPKLSPEPPSFDGDTAFADLATIVKDYPQRVAGSDPDNRMGIWVEQQFHAMGLETHIDGFAATVNGKAVALQNVWAVSKGHAQGTIMVLANRDVPPLATQGAGDNASGVAALLGLAQAFTVTGHDHSIIFLCTTGDAYGALGARQFAEEHQTDDLYSVIALRDVAKRDSHGIGLDGWSTVPKTAPPWLWLLTAPAARRDSNMDAELPTVAAQVLRLAVPASAGGQGPFVAAGVPAVTVSAAGPSAPVRSRHARHRVEGDADQGGHDGAGHDDGRRRHHVARRAERRHHLPHARRRCRAARSPPSSPPCSCPWSPSPSTSSPAAVEAGPSCAPPSSAPASTSPLGSSSSRSSTSPTWSACCRTAPAR